MELITVGVVTYNSEKTILDTLNSIREQDYPKIELIISDDGSSDGTVAVVKKWLKSNHAYFENCRLLIGRSNHGTVYSLNRIINQAGGKYIQFIAGDDMLFSYTLSRKYEYAEANNSDVVFTRVKCFGDDYAQRKIIEQRFNRGYAIARKDLDMQKSIVMEYNFMYGPTASFVRREYMEKIGGYDKRYHILEDHPFLFNYIFAGNRVELFEEELGMYRINGSGISNSNNKRLNRVRFKFFLWQRIWALLKAKKFKLVFKQLYTFVKECI